MARSPSLVTMGQRRHPFRCSICQGAEFQDREILLNTSGAEYLNLGWANKSATGLVCMQCGYVHTFMSDAIELWRPDGGYPPAPAY